MPTYISELRVCKICHENYYADVLISSNTFSQSIESIQKEFRRHKYWLCDSCWDKNQYKSEQELKIYIPNQTDFEKQKCAEKSISDAEISESLRYEKYRDSLSEFYINYDMYTKFLIKLFDCLSEEIDARDKPYRLYIDDKEFDPNYIFGNQTIGYLFDPTKKGPNISISYDLTTYSGNIAHNLPKIIISSGFKYHSICYEKNVEVSKNIFNKDISWKLDVETHKEIRELNSKSYSWRESNFVSGKIEYKQHIYFSTDLINDLIRVFDDYYRVFGTKFKQIRKMFLDQQFNFVNENLEGCNDFSPILEMRLYNEPFTDI